MIYSEKATKFCEIFISLLSYVVPVKSKVKILQNFVAFSEYIYSWCVRGQHIRRGEIITSFMNSPLPQRCLHSRTFPNIGVRRFLPDRDRHRRNPWNRVHIHIGHSDNRKSHNLYWIRIEDGVKYSGAASNTASTNSAYTVLVKVIRHKSRGEVTPLRMP